MNAAMLLLVLAAQPSAELVAKKSSYVPDPVSTVISVKLGPYQPNVDASPGLVDATPYDDIFGDSSGVYVVPQVRLLRDFGVVGLGASVAVGYVSQSAKALVDDGDDETPASGDKVSGGETSIRVIPIFALAVVRLRGVAEWLDFPIIPYVETGVAYAFWRVGKGDGSAAASGGSMGWAINAGVALRLDTFEPFASKALRDQFGVVGTELTIEWSHLSTDGFGRGETFRVGDSTWTAGLGIGF